VDKTIGAGGLKSYIIDKDTNLVVDSRSSLVVGDYTLNIGNLLFGRSITLPAAREYVIVVTADYTGALEQDDYSVESFSVPAGSCVAYDDAPLREFIIERLNQTNGYVNTTSATVHAHIDSHFNQTYTFLNTSFGAQETLILFRTSQTNSYVNSSRVAILSALNDFELNVDCGENGTQCEFEAMTMIDLPGMTDQQVGAFLLFLILLLISFFQRWLFVAIASVIGILDVVLIGGIFGFTFTGLLVVLGIVLQILVDHRDAMNEKKAEREGGEIGD
jgi:hypothetical protein